MAANIKPELGARKRAPDPEFAFRRKQWSLQYSGDARITSATVIKALNVVMWNLRGGEGQEYAEIGLRSIANIIGKSVTHTRRTVQQIAELGHWSIQPGKQSTAGDAGERMRFFPRWDGMIRGEKYARHRTAPGPVRSASTETRLVSTETERPVPSQGRNGPYRSRDGTDSNNLKRTLSGGAGAERDDSSRPRPPTFGKWSNSTTSEQPVTNEQPTKQQMKQNFDNLVAEMRSRSNEQR